MYESYVEASSVHDVKCRVLLWSVACVTSYVQVMLWPLMCMMSYYNIYVVVSGVHHVICTIVTLRSIERMT